MSNIERRAFEMRAAEGEFAIVGRAISYDTTSQDLGGFVEQIAPGAFAQSIRAGDVKFYWSHDSGQPLARQSNGSLQITDSRAGLDFKAKLDPQVQAHHDAYRMCQSGLINSMSFAFKVDEQSWDQGKQPPLRRVLKGTLFEISIVMEPAYAGAATSAEARQAGLNAAKTEHQTHGLAEAIKTLRKVAAITFRSLHLPRPDFLCSRDSMTGDEFALIGEHMMHCHDACELAFAHSGTCRDMFDAWKDCGEGYDDDDDACRAAQMNAHYLLDQACQELASARLLHARRVDAHSKKRPLARK